nr:sigma-54-dependent Fis family transcriptional regulator [candidate division Zixibacteria bacterium]
MKINVLAVDDDKLANEFFTETLKRAGYEVTSAFSAEEALQEIENKPFDIVVSDIRMKNMDGIELLQKARQLQPEMVVILVTAYGTVENAVRAMKLGAYDFLLKPVSPDALEIVVERAAELVSLRNENRQLKSDLANRYQDIIGKSSQMRQIFDLIATTARARSTVMITGESGTGKEMVARAIHYASDRKDRPFITLNCAALPENLVEAELFGYEKGAFTGAIKQHKGRFEIADGGTLLLDEISEMPTGLQAKLLRVLQERCFERVGSTATIEVDVRIIATSNRNLKELIKQEKFREDLYYRLNVIPVHLPPLRERLGDIPLLIQHFIEKYNDENGKMVSEADENVMRMMMRYHWPGNVRELENYIERAIVTSSSNILSQNDFPNDLVLGKLADEISGISVGMSLADGEKYLILKTLEQYGGNKTKTAEILNVTPRTIRNKLAEYNIETDD